MTEETFAEYISAALDDPNPDVFLTAVRDVARARGLAELARATGIERGTLSRTLAPGSRPHYDTILKLLHGLGVKLSVTPVQQ